MKTSDDKLAEAIRQLDEAESRLIDLSRAEGRYESPEIKEARADVDRLYEALERIEGENA